MDRRGRVKHESTVCDSAQVGDLHETKEFMPAISVQKIFTCRRKLGTRSWSRPRFHLVAPPMIPPHPCEHNASGPRARLSSVDSDRQGEPWLGLARSGAGGLPRPLEGGTTGQRQPHRLFRAREKAQNRRTGSPLGSRHHLRTDLGRLHLSGGGARCIQPPGGRLGDGQSPANRAGAWSTQHGAVAAASR